MNKKSQNIQKWVSHSAVETKQIGRKLAKELLPGHVVALYGNLGTGKTTMVKGIAEGVGVKSGGEVASPTFVVIHEYLGKLKIYHLDWYRLKKIVGVDALMAEECLYSDGVTLVEWPERGEMLLPPHHWVVRISHKDPSTRLIEVSKK